MWIVRDLNLFVQYYWTWIILYEIIIFVFIYALFIKNMSAHVLVPAACCLAYAAASRRT